jgi:cholesterol oxidase
MRIASIRLKREGKEVDWLLPNLAVTFANPDQTPVPGQPIHGTGPEGQAITAWDPSKGPIPSMFGRTRLTCVMCGQCDVGCNIGSKNTLDHTYLSAAILQPGPTTIMTRTEVKEMEPHNGGYRIRYVDHRYVEELVKREPGKKPELRTVTARYLILSAGALGSTFLMLKNRDHFPKVDRNALGTRFCGNGDLLSFIQKCVDDEQKPHTPRVLDTGYGPVITSALRFPDRHNGTSNGYYYIEDAGYPEAVNWILELTTPLSTIKRGARLGWRLARGWLRIDPDADIGAEFASFIGDTVLSKSSMPLLAMGRDTPDGKMTLQPDGLLDINWNIKGSGGYFKRVRASAKDIARVLGGRFRDNPLTLLSRVITVHPLGGCPMDGADWKGVVDSYGRVHGYEGFLIADGSVVPGPVGPNPSLTIAALADRFADQLIADHQAKVAGSARNLASHPPESSPRATVQPGAPVSP